MLPLGRGAARATFFGCGTTVAGTTGSGKPIVTGRAGVAGAPGDDDTDPVKNGTDRVSTEPTAGTADAKGSAAEVSDCALASVCGAFARTGGAFGACFSGAR